MAQATGYNSVNWWLGRLAESTRRMARYNLEDWFKWLRVNGGKFSAMSPDELIQHQKAATVADQYEVLDVVQAWIMGVEGRLGYKQTKFNHVKSFFMHSRAPLPRDASFTLRGDKPRVLGQLSPDDIRRIVLRSNRLYQAVFMSMLGGGMDQESLIYWSDNGLDSLRAQLSRDAELIRVDLPGRKANKNAEPFYTLLGGDAVAALKNWMVGHPAGAPTIFVDQFGDRLSKTGLYAYWRRQVLELGLSEKGTKTRRVWSGRNVHEVRDVYRTLWAKSGAAPQIAEYMMGHSNGGDPYGYDKSMRDEAYVRKQYRQALPLLNILTSAAAYGLVGEERVAELEAKQAATEIKLDQAIAALKEIYEREKPKT